MGEDAVTGGCETDGGDVGDVDDGVGDGAPDDGRVAAAVLRDGAVPTNFGRGIGPVASRGRVV
ncbi:MAG: hypothetical protein RLZZ201_1176, partial [Actinomycetota bacterium]